MKKLDARLLVLERHAEPATLLPSIVPDCTSDEEIERMRRTGQKVFRESDPLFFDELIL